MAISRENAARAAGAIAVIATIIVFVFMRKKKSESFLIYPYTDLENDGYRGNPYALSEEPNGLPY